MQMLAHGYLSQYSLAEIFNLIQEGKKNGVLSIEPRDGSIDASKVAQDSTLEIPCYYVSFQGGRVMSIFYGLEYENQDLLAMVLERQWIPLEQIKELKKKLSGLTIPWGLQLKVWEIISVDRLRLLFDIQVLSQLAKIFEISEGKFRFDPHAELNYPEMTGLSLSARNAVLLGLRGLKDWSRLTNKLPAPESRLQRASSELQGSSLENDEQLVWQLALGEMSVLEIAAQLNLEIDKVRQIGFRLCSIGLTHEVAVKPSPPIEIVKPVCVGGGNPNIQISTAFVSKLIGFLKQQKG
ncbi:DUF4388 domain-containing protein [Chamaesiphon polymorphus]|nr:DUF4388 domain-containing protein [Chamaesiphon polymorphus]